jgi:hypothetical protein
LAFKGRLLSLLGGEVKDFQHALFRHLGGTRKSYVVWGKAEFAALDRLAGVSNAQVLVKQHRDQLVFLHQVVPGAADKSWGVHVARLAGVPELVIERARDLLLGFETHGAVGAQPVKPRRKAEPADQLPLFGEEG